MTEAIFGLTGVIIGALISGLTSLLMQKRNARLTARVAARLVRDDLYIASCWVEDAIVAEKWLEDTQRKINTQSWQDQRIHLAAVMNYSDYAKAGTAVQAANRLNHWLTTISNDVTINETDKDYLKKLLEDLGSGLFVLKETAR